MTLRFRAGDATFLHLSRRFRLHHVLPQLQYSSLVEVVDLWGG